MFDPAGNLYLALREGNAIYRVDGRASTLHHVAGTGEQGFSGDGGPPRLARLAGPKDPAWSNDILYVADTESHVVREIDLKAGNIRTVLGTGTRGDGPESDPRRCALARPHGVLVDSRGVLYVGDSEAHRIRVLVRESATLVARQIQRLVNDPMKTTRMTRKRHASRRCAALQPSTTRLG